MSDKQPSLPIWQRYCLLIVAVLFVGAVCRAVGVPGWLELLLAAMIGGGSALTSDRGR